MSRDDLPIEVRRSVQEFLAAIDETSPGLITGFYLVGSLAFGDFHPHGAGFGRLSTASDIDFVAVTGYSIDPDSPQMAALAAAHAHTMARFGRPYFDGAILTSRELAAGPAACPDVPCAQEGRFTAAGRSGVNPVTFCELAWHGVTVRGPAPADIEVWADRKALRTFTIDNLRNYWLPWWQQHSERRPLPLAIGLTPWFPVWAVLGLSRLHHLLATGTLTSKTGAGRYARETFDQSWHSIIDESLALRTGGAQGRRGYRNPVARRRDTLNFLDHTITSALALTAQP